MLHIMAHMLHVNAHKCIIKSCVCRQAQVRDPEVIKCVRNMWWNPKVPGDTNKSRVLSPSRESALSPLARDMAASQAGSRCALIAFTMCQQTTCAAPHVCNLVEDDPQPAECIAQEAYHALPVQPGIGQLVAAAVCSMSCANLHQTTHCM